jgi:hypothetical protein
MDVADVSGNASTWEKVVRKLRTESMPPAGAPRPDKTTYESTSLWLETSLDTAAAAHLNPGRPALHRLNRTEYGNAVRDLLSLDIDAASLVPPDDSTYGFDNIADALGVSPTLLERYISAARKISRLAVGDSSARPAATTYRAVPDLTQDIQLDGLPVGTRGGMFVQHYFPADGDYLIRLKLGRSVHQMLRGMVDEHQLELSVDGARVKLFKVGGFGTSKGAADSRFLDGYSAPEDLGMEMRLSVKAGPHTVAATFIKEDNAEVEDAPIPIVGAKSPGPALREPFLKSYIYYLDDGLPYVTRLVVDGPYDVKGPGDTPSRRRIFVCSPSSQAQEPLCAKQIIATLERRAYRRPVTDADVQKVMTFYDAERRQGNSFDDGIEISLRALLASPEFLFRVERDPANVPPGTAYRISDLELASRLSFFLWSSIPDDELVNLAERGALHNPNTLEKQVRRMLADPKSDALVTNFADQWLYLRNLKGVYPHPLLFPNFDDNLRQAMRQETQLFFRSIIQENRSALDLLNADYTFMNERLARHYGIDNVYGTEFRRVTLTDPNRRGLLGQASILTVTSQPTRTSPVVRGKWILDNLLGAPPPPKPADVPDLKDDSPDGRVLSMRDRMAQHRANPACASCHSRMDPLGLSLEPFDLVGQLRVRSESNGPIDASGALPDGTKFDGPAGLREALLKEPDTFVQTLTEKLLTYGLGRGLDYYDAPVVRNIMRKTATSHYKLSSIIIEITRSTPFDMRRSAELRTTMTAAGDARH